MRRVTMTVLVVTLVTAYAFAHGGHHHAHGGTAPTIGVAVAFDAVNGKGENVAGRLTITLPKGWHLYAQGAPEEFTPLAVTQRPGVVDDWRATYPKAGHVAYEGAPIPVYEGETVVSLTGTMAADPPAVWQGAVTFQACSADLCLAPETREVSAPVS